MSEEIEAVKVPLNIYQRLNEVRKAVAYIRKNKQVMNYMAVTHDAVTEAVREFLIEFGIMILPDLESCAFENTGMTTGKGTPIMRLSATYLIKFANVDQPSDFIQLRMCAHALDEGDKAPGKALSYATKYAMLKIFSIETGEDDEDRITAKVSRKIQTDKGKVIPTAGSIEALPQEMQSEIGRVADEILEAFEAGKPTVAAEIWYADKHSNDEKVALWSLLPSKCRSAIKKTPRPVAPAARLNEPAPFHDTPSGPWPGPTEAAA